MREGTESSIQRTGQKIEESPENVEVKPDIIEGTVTDYPDED